MAASAPSDQTPPGTGHVISPTDSQNEALLANQAQTPRFAWLTTIRLLITINVLVFFAMLAYDYHVVGRNKFMAMPIASDFETWLWLNWGGDYGVLTLGGQYWRVITSMFVHANIVHLSTNMLFLWSFGRYLDRILGRTKSLIVYLLCGVACSLLELSWRPGAVFVGASGAIYGQAGVLISFFVLGNLGLPRGRKIRLSIWIALLTPVGLLTGHPAKGVAYAGHLGGFVAGLAIGIFLAWTFRAPQERHASLQRRVLLLTTAAMIVIFAGVVLGHRNLIKLYHQELALKDKDLIAFMAVHIQRLIAEDPNDAEAHSYLGFAYHLQNRDEEAVAEYRRALELDPNNYAIKQNLAFIYWATMRYEDAVPLYRACLAHLNGTSQDYVQFATALMMTKRLGEAEEAARKAVALDNNSANGHGTLASVLLLRGKKVEAEREQKLADQLPKHK